MTKTTMLPTEKARDVPAPGKESPSETITQTAREAAMARAAACGREIEQVLARHGCRVVPLLRPLEPIGHDGSKAMVQASYAIIPDPL